jgi:hypothetical protein
MKSLLLILLASLAFAPSVFAHHSQAEFDTSNVLEMEGKIVAAYWRNPHVNFTLKMLNDADEEEVWELEAGAWNTLSGRGITKSAITVGDRITVAVNPSSKRSFHARLRNVLLASGAELVLINNAGARWSDTLYAVENSDVVAPIDVGTASATGSLFQVWSIKGGRRVPLDRELPLTESAKAAQAVWDPITQDPLLQCNPPGMPPTMGNPYPMQFIERDGNIILHLEEFDNVRTIYMNDNAVSVAPSALGFSIGRWEQGSLLVETNNINYPYFNRVGVAQTGYVTTSERFALSDDGLRLDYRLTITDPATLTEPVSWSTYYVAGLGEVIKPYECTVERYVPR